MILLYHFLSRNERFYISFAFIVASLVFWNFIPSHNEVKLTFVPLDVLEKPNLQNNQTPEKINILWMTSGQDIENALSYQSTFRSKTEDILFYIKNKMDKNQKRIISSDYANTINADFIDDTSNFDKTISICDLHPYHFHVQHVGEFSFHNWWKSILRKERKEEWHHGKEGALECPNPLSIVSIGRIAWEYDTFPAFLLSRVNLMDQIWAPSQNTRNALIAAGVEADIVTIPVYTNTSFWDPALYLSSGVNDTTFRFAINFIEHNDNRKIHFLIHSFLEEFSLHENVELDIITNEQEALRKKVVRYIENRPLNVLQSEPEKTWPRIIYHNNDQKEESIAHLYNTFQCFIYTSGFQTHPGEAMSMELTSITDVPTEHMRETNSYIIPKLNLPRDISETEIQEKLAEKFKLAMRRAFSNPMNTRAKGKRARNDLILGLENNPYLIQKTIQELKEKTLKRPSKEK